MILVTGATGFVGSHVAQQLLAAGQNVRVLVRSPQKVQSLFTGGAQQPDVVAGDITDLAAVERAVQGCQGVVHAAAATPISCQSIEDMFRINVEGVRNVVSAALAQDIQRIVHVSSITAIFNPDASKVTAEAPPVPSSMPYGQSKVEAEIYLRALQREGAPIAIVYPGGVIGPDDPGFSDTCKALQHRINNGFRIFGDGGMQHVDVRDLAQFIVSLMAEGGSGRFLLPGVYLKWTELADIIEQQSGCQLQRIPAKGWKLRLMGRAIDLLRKVRTVDAPISAETMRYATLWPNIANTVELERRGLCLRDPGETFGDTLRWMVKAGHLDAQTCPALSHSADDKRI